MFHRIYLVVSSKIQMRSFSWAHSLLLSWCAGQLGLCKVLSYHLISNVRVQDKENNKATTKEKKRKKRPFDVIQIYSSENH